MYHHSPGAYRYMVSQIIDLVKFVCFGPISNNLSYAWRGEDTSESANKNNRAKNSEFWFETAWTNLLEPLGTRFKNQSDRTFKNQHPRIKE